MSLARACTVAQQSRRAAGAGRTHHGPPRPTDTPHPTTATPGGRKEDRGPRAAKGTSRRTHQPAGGLAKGRKGTQRPAARRRRSRRAPGASRTANRRRAPPLCVPRSGGRRRETCQGATRGRSNARGRRTCHRQRTYRERPGTSLRLEATARSSPRHHPVQEAPHGRRRRRTRSKGPERGGTGQTARARARPGRPAPSPTRTAGAPSAGRRAQSRGTHARDPCLVGSHA